MRRGQPLLRCVLLSAALAAVASTPAASAAARGTYTDLHDFAGGVSDGVAPQASVTLDDLGNIYGTAASDAAGGLGVVFKLASDGTQTVLHSFSGSDGSAPLGGMVFMGTALYGTTSLGGANGDGVLFKLSENGNYEVLHNFSNNTDGRFAEGTLIRDKLGNLYGTASAGGTYDYGTVFKYGFDGTFTVLHAFHDVDGRYPSRGVVPDKDGNLYGATREGGDHDAGTVFKLAPNGQVTTLHSFSGWDGAYPYGRLDIDTDGNLYGATTNGGPNNVGTVFKVAPDGTFATLYTFTGDRHGGEPESDVLFAGGKVYGTTLVGGAQSCWCGVVYEITPAGKAKVLHAFTGTDGGGFSAGLVRRSHVFYGTTIAFGAHSKGVVFRLTKR